MKKRLMPDTNTLFFHISLLVIFLLSFYPLLMGGKLLAAYFRYGYVSAEAYPKYVIPYTPIAIALVLCTALLPVVKKRYKEHALTALSIIGSLVFLHAEIAFERVVVFDGNSLLKTDVGGWQAYMCYITPEAMRAYEFQRTIGFDLAQRYNPSFKIHFYLISFLIVISVMGVVHGYSKMICDKDHGRKKPLIIQTIAVGIFVGLCILACFTAFYRTGALYISTVSSLLMTDFFVVFGLTAGVYAGSLLYFKKPVYSLLVPALIACLATACMYVGELILMGGVVFRLGRGLMFDPLFTGPLAPVDFAVILLAGILTYFILYLIRQRKEPSEASK